MSLELGFGTDRRETCRPDLASAVSQTSIFPLRLPNSPTTTDPRPGGKGNYTRIGEQGR